VLKAPREVPELTEPRGLRVLREPTAQPGPRALPAHPDLKEPRALQVRPALCPVLRGRKVLKAQRVRKVLQARPVQWQALRALPVL
jgi:hypothetical protein